MKLDECHFNINFCSIILINKIQKIQKKINVKKKD